MTKNLIILLLILWIIYLYQKKPATDADLKKQLSETTKVNKIFATFCQNEIGGADIEEIRTKLNGRKLSEILAENQDYELEIDTLRRTKGELEADLLAQSNSFKSLLREKEGAVKRLEKEKKDLQEFSKKELEKLKAVGQKEQSEIEKSLDQVIKVVNDLSNELDYERKD